MSKILLIEDNTEVRENTAEILELANYTVTTAENGKVGVEKALQEKPDLIICDIMMPVLDGFTTCERIRKFSTVPIIVVTVKGEEKDRVRGLDLGADDYIVKPYQPKVLIARIEALLRRHCKPGEEKPAIISAGALSIDPAAREVTLGTVKLKLTKTEFDILLLLSRHPNQVFTRDRIIDEIRGNDYSITERVVDFQVAGLRKKLGAAAACIETIRGVGYKFISGAAPC